MPYGKLQVLVRALVIYYIGRSILKLTAVQFQSSGLILEPDPIWIAQYQTKWITMGKT